MSNHHKDCIYDIFGDFPGSVFFVYLLTILLAINPPKRYNSRRFYNCHGNACGVTTVPVEAGFDDDPAGSQKIIEKRLNMNELANLDNYLTDPDYAKPPYEAPIDEEDEDE